MRNGILLYDSETNISGTDFYDFEGTRPSTITHPVLDLNQYAIYMQRSAVDIEDNTINNVLVGLYAEESMNTIYDNQISLAVLEPPIAGYARGIDLIRPQKAIVDSNYITNGWRGISLENVTMPFEVKNNNLERNITYGINLAIFIKSLKYSNGEEGVIKNNHIYIDDGHGAMGIYLLDVSSIAVDNNTIEFTEIGGIGFQHKGIAVKGGRGNRIIRNTVMADESYISQNSYGIQLNLSSANILSCNSVENFWSNINILGPNLISPISTNLVSDGLMGLEIEGPAMIGRQSILLNNGHEEGIGNIWSGDFSGTNEFGAFISGSSIVATAKNCKFIVDSNEDSDFLPVPIGPAAVNLGNWFEDKSNNDPTFVCLSILIFPNPDTIAELLKSALTYEVYNDEMTWMMKADIYEMMLFDPDLHSNAVLDSFFDVEETNVLGKLIQCQFDLASRFGVQQPRKNLLQDSIVQLSVDILYIDSILLLKPSDSLTWIALRGMKADSMALNMNNWTQLLEDEREASLDAYTDIAVYLDNLTPGNDMEEYLRQALLYKTQFLHGISFSSTDSVDISNLEDICPWLGGRAVFIAKELYSTLVDSLTLSTSVNCPSSSPLIGRPGGPYRDIDSELIVFPNPSSDKILVKSNSVIFELLISDLSGLIFQKFQPFKSSLSIDTRSLPGGIYIISVITEADQSTQRIIVAK